jgi:hypothetical protein
MQNQDIFLVMFWSGIIALAILTVTVFRMWKRNKEHPFAQTEWWEKIRFVIAFIGVTMAIIAGLIGPCNR